jgi:hypothetical protein
MPALRWHIRHPPDDMSLESDGGMIYWRENPKNSGKKPVPVPLCPPQIPHGLTRAWTPASAVRGRRLTTWDLSHGAAILLQIPKLYFAPFHLITSRSFPVSYFLPIFPFLLAFYSYDHPANDVWPGSKPTVMLTYTQPHLSVLHGTYPTHILTYGLCRRVSAMTDYISV